jgi:hypothetical protein
MKQREVSVYHGDKITREKGEKPLMKMFKDGVVDGSIPDDDDFVISTRSIQTNKVLQYLASHNLDIRIATTFGNKVVRFDLSKYTYNVELLEDIFDATFPDLAKDFKEYLECDHLGNHLKFINNYRTTGFSSKMDAAILCYGIKFGRSFKRVTGIGTPVILREDDDLLLQYIVNNDRFITNDIPAYRESLINMGIIIPYMDLYTDVLTDDTTIDTSIKKDLFVDSMIDVVMSKKPSHYYKKRLNFDDIIWFLNCCGFTTSVKVM